MSFVAEAFECVSPITEHNMHLECVQDMHTGFGLPKRDEPVMSQSDPKNEVLLEEGSFQFLVWGGIKRPDPYS